MSSRALTEYSCDADGCDEKTDDLTEQWMELRIAVGPSKSPDTLEILHFCTVHADMLKQAARIFVIQEVWTILGTTYRARVNAIARAVLEVTG